MYFCFPIYQIRYLSTTRILQATAQQEDGENAAKTKGVVSERGTKISQAMRAYLDRAKAHNEFMSEEIAEYEIGKRHLAVIMGEDPDTFSQDDIDRAIRYLLPSGLFDKKARPIMKHPTEVIPARKAAQFDMDGRPFHSMYYTCKPNFHQLMHDCGVKLESLQKYEDTQNALGLRPSAEAKIELAGSIWITKSELEKRVQEKLSDGEYLRLTKLLERIVEQPYSINEKETVMSFREHLVPQTMLDQLPEIQYDASGRGYIDAIGYRKTAKATVRVWEKGSGKITINDSTYLDHFPRLLDRQQIMFPLQVCGLLRGVDIVAQVEGGGVSGQAGAMRLGISRALQGFVTKQMVETMRLAGLLTWDPRTRERKKPGQERARKKFTWKKR